MEREITCVEWAICNGMMKQMPNAKRNGKRKRSFRVFESERGIHRKQPVET